MEYRKLGSSGLEVSELALGTMQFGWTADEDTAFAILDAYAQAGGNLIVVSRTTTSVRLESVLRPRFKVADFQKSHGVRVARWKAK